ncbi:hypothetical protein LPJ61_005114, partial [Coemansia biformis]
METGDLYSDAGSTRLDAAGQRGDSMEIEEQAGDAGHGGDGEYDDGEDYEDGEALEDDLPMLMRAWVNERNAPELLEYEGTTVENLMEL